MNNKLHQELVNLDNETLREWGQSLDKIKDFLAGKMDDADSHELLMLIDDFATKSRERTRTSAVWWLLRLADD